MNDNDELVSADEIIVDVVESLLPSQRGEARLALERFLAEYPTLKISHAAGVFLACLSEARDKASQ